MAFSHSTNGLIARIRDIAGVGTSTRDQPPSRLIRTLNAEIGDYLVPFILTNARKGYFETFLDVPLVAGISTYRIPSKACGDRLRAIQLVDASGNPYAPLKEFPLEEQINFGNNGTPVQGTPVGYAFLGNT